jgi:hypothetical protein
MNNHSNEDPRTDAPAKTDEEGRLPQGNAREYLLAGNAVVTFRNSSTGNRFTYKVRRPDDAHPHFVSIPGGGEGWTFMGTIFDSVTYRHGKRSSISRDSQSAKTFEWLWRNIDSLPAEIEIWHEGSCLRCGRQLTVPESIKRGYGSVCAELLGIA